MGLGGIAVLGAVLYMILGLTTWKDYEEGVSWGVVILYAGAISLGSAFKATGAAGWLADSIMTVVAPLGMNSGIPLVILVIFVGAGLTNLMSAGATVAVIGPVILGMDRSQVLSKFFDWSDKFGFKIDGDYLTIEGGETDFFSSLDQQFSDWENKEETKQGKMADFDFEM